jgi:NAD(P)-dependent dehydrogenase (short-subunit alcohol dehydrogenase family)
MKTRTWFVTGIASGFGYAVSRRVLEEGGRVAGTTRSPEASEVRALVDAHNDRFLVLEDGLRDDVARSSAWEAVKRFGVPDVVLLNAGFGVFGAVEEVRMTDVLEMLQVNFVAQIDMLRHCLPAMRERGGGVIFVMGAAASIANYPGFAAYGASKAALEFAAESLAQEVRPFGIRVHILQPGPFRTRFLKAGMERSLATGAVYEGTVGKFMKILGSMEGKQSGDPDRAAALILELCDREDVPLRIPLGKYAADKARRVAAARLRDLEKTSFAEATDFGA